MRVFVTGATGFIGAHIVTDLIAAGHQVLGLTRSDHGAQALAAAGAEAHRGTLEDPETLRTGAAGADGVIHTAFDHDFSNFAANCDKDRRAIEALGSALKGSSRPLVITSGTGFGAAAHGQPATENVFNPTHPNPRVASELAGQALSAAGLNVSVVRLPQVHDTHKQGLITPAIEIARAKGASAYLNDGANRLSAAHVRDVARLYRLALDSTNPAPATTPSPRKASRSATSPKSSARACTCRSYPCRRKPPPGTLVGWRSSSASISWPRGSGRSNASAGTPPAPACSPTCGK